MSSTALLQLAELIELPVPDDYLELLNQFPAELQTAVRSEDGSDDEGTVAEYELIQDPESILAINLESRAESVLDPDGEEFFWPNQLIVIGETGCGDYYCIDASGEHSGVLLFENQAVEFSEIAESLQEFIDILMESFAG
jgi:hypothetical protein